MSMWSYINHYYARPSLPGLTISLRHTFDTKHRVANIHEYDIADPLGTFDYAIDMRNRKVTRRDAHGVPKRLRDAVNSSEAWKLIIAEGAPTSRQVAKMA